MGHLSVLFSHGSPMQVEEPPVSVDFCRHKVVVIVPSYNEERFIGSVVLKLLCFPVTVIVVDDGSTDATAEVAALAGAMVFKMETNQGKGAAINTGFSEARKLNPDALVLIDADGQHLPEELPRVVRPILDGEADLVVGSRYLRQTSHVPANRVLGHLFFKWLTSITSGISISDSQSGYRAFSPRAFNLIQFHSRGFSVESEMQFMARDQGLRVAEVPITIRYDDPPKRSALRQGMHVLNGVLRLTGQFRPLLFFGLPGFILAAIGVGWSAWVVDIFSNTGNLAIGYTLFSAMFAILGMTLFTTGLILHTMRGLLNEFLKERGL